MEIIEIDINEFEKDIYNEYIEKLISRHIENILFEFNNPILYKTSLNCFNH